MQDIPHLMGQISWRALLQPRGERCRLCQVSGHKEHTWGGITCPGLCPEPAQSNPSTQPQDVLKESSIQGLQGSNHCWLHSVTPPARPAKDLGPAAPAAAAEPWEEQSSSSAEQLPRTGAISWERNVPSLNRKRN